MTSTDLGSASGAPQHRGGIVISVFGGIRLWRSGVEITGLSSRQRTILAELVAASGDVVTVSEMISALWIDDPPSSATNQVQRIVGELRRILEPHLLAHAGGEVILAAGNGYRIAPELIQCDLFEFRERVTSAEAAVRRGDKATASEIYADALELSRGFAFAGLANSVTNRPEFTAVERERVAVTIAAADLSIEHGPSPRLLAAVERLTAGVPFDEALHARLMRLLALSGRPAEALRVFDELRARLAEELGVDPGPEVRRAHRDLLEEDRAAAPTTRAPDERPRPAQLPRPLRGFVTREGAEESLTMCLADIGTTGAIAAIGGMAGIGKTALAVHWAHSVIEHFPDGQLYLNLRRFDPSGMALDPGEALSFMLESLGLPRTEFDARDVEATGALFRSRISGRRMLVLLDNARDSEHVRALLPGSPDCVVVVTSRIRLADLVAREGAVFVPLGRLQPSAAQQLLANRIGLARVAHEHDAVSAIVARCAGHPLALSIVAARVATNPDLPIIDATGLTFGDSAELDALTTEEGRDDVRAIFASSYGALPEEAARVFRLLAAHPGQECSLASIASLAGRNVAHTQLQLRTLVSAHMLEEPRSGRYSIHDLLRAYAEELLDTAGERDEAEHRLIEHYARSTRAAYLTYGRLPIAPLATVFPALTPEDFADTNGAMEWYIQERAVLVSLVDLCLTKGLVRTGTLTLLDLRPMSQTSVEPYSFMLARTKRALAMIGQIDEPILHAELERDLGSRSTNDPPTAQAHFQRALDIYATVGDAAGKANTYRNMVVLADTLGQPEEAARYASLSVSASRRSGRDDLLGLSMNVESEALCELGRWDEAIAAAQEAVSLLTAGGNLYSVPTALQTLASAYLGAGEARSALAAGEAALTRQLQLAPDLAVLAAIWAVIAVSALACGERERAVQACDAFVRIHQSLPIDSIHGASVDTRRAIAQVDAVRDSLGVLTDD